MTFASVFRLTSFAAAAKINPDHSSSARTWRILTPSRSAAGSQTSRSSFAMNGRRNKSDLSRPFNVLQLVEDDTLALRCGCVPEQCADEPGLLQEFSITFFSCIREPPKTAFRSWDDGGSSVFGVKGFIAAPSVCIFKTFDPLLIIVGRFRF